MNRKILWIALAVIAFCLLAAGGTILISKAAINRLSLPPEIKVINRSGEDLREVRLEGSGFSADLGILHKGETRRITVHPTGESGIYVSFLAEGSEYKSAYESYIESSGGYRVVITIDRNFEVESRYGYFLLP